jgi:hypothetical protein
MAQGPKETFFESLKVWELEVYNNSIISLVEGVQAYLSTWAEYFMYRGIAAHNNLFAMWNGSVTASSEAHFGLQKVSPLLSYWGYLHSTP